MAENKNNQTNTPDTQGNTPDTQGTARKTTTKGSKKEKLVSVFIPKTSRNDTERFIAVNGERILVQTGKNVEIPERFAEVIENSKKMSVVADEYINDNATLT